MYNILNENGEVFVPALKGEDGKSAYEIAVDDGFIGTEEEWLESLKGKDGVDGKDGEDNSVYYLKDPAKTYLVIKITEENDTFELLTGTDGSPDYTIEWGDGESEAVTTTDNPSHIYETAGMYLITISDEFENGIVVGSGANVNKNKIIEVYGGSNYPLSIATNAFRGCTSLTTANFPNATSVENSAFLQCSSLTTANVHKATSIGQSAFYTCSSLTTANVPKTTSIGDGAFGGCNSLTTVNFPNATSIGYEVFTGLSFQNCTSLTTANFPKVTFIANNAFENCTSLKELTLGKITTTNPGTSRFKDVKLVNLTIAQDVTANDIESIKQFYADNGGTFIGTQINSI